MKLRLALAAATCLALPLAMHSTAQAQPVTGPYVSLGAGTALEVPSASSYGYSVSGTYGEGDTYTDYFKYSYKNQFKPSYAGVIAAGYGFGNGFRVELGGDFIRNSFWNTSETGYYGENDNFGESYSSSFGPEKVHATGGEEKYGPMVNAYYDFSVGLPVYPYIGAGVGYQWVKLNRDYTNDDLNPVKVDGTKGSFAYEIIAGLSYPLPSLPQLSLTAEYRFMQLVQSRNYGYDLPEGYNSNGDTKFKMGQESYNMFLVGLRYQIIAPPVMAPPVPAPMASPAPAAAKTYLVFFDWDKYALTPRATQIIAEAASDSKTSSVTTIDVSGYTDTSGTPTYNQGLSERRAKAVAAKLVVDGVPASEISIHAYGETHLLVPTGPGVREPQNRRVEIVLN
jgi:outer membrane protein OmpA-like peptidoglycan-associated protein